MIVPIVVFAFLCSFEPSWGRQYIKILTFFWLISLDFKSTINLIKNSVILQLILIFSAWIIFGDLLTEKTITQKHTVNSTGIYFRYFITPLLIVCTSIKKENIPLIVKFFILGMLVNEVISYSMHFGLVKDNLFGLKLVGNANNPIPFVRSHIEYTTLLAFAITASFFTMLKSKHLYTKIFLTLFIASMTTNMFITNGRTGQMILIANVTILSLIYFKHNYKYIVSALGVLIIVFLLGYNLSDNVHSRANQAYKDIDTLVTHNDFDTSLGIRIAAYLMAPTIVERQPWYGFGFKNEYLKIHELYMEFHPNQPGFKSVVGHLHNTFIHVLSGTGLIGLFIFLLIIYKATTLPINDEFTSFIRYTFLLTIIFNGVSSALFWQRELMLFSSIFFAIIICTLNSPYHDEEDLEIGKYA